MNELQIKIDGCVHAVKFVDNGEKVDVRELVWGDVVTSGWHIHPRLRRMLEDCIAEVVDGLTACEDVDVQYHM